MRRCTSPRVAAIVRAIKIISREELAQRLANQTKGASSKGSTVGTWISWQMLHLDADCITTTLSDVEGKYLLVRVGIAPIRLQRTPCKNWAVSGAIQYSTI